MNCIALENEAEPLPIRIWSFLFFAKHGRIDIPKINFSFPQSSPQSVKPQRINLMGAHAHNLFPILVPGGQRKSVASENGPLGRDNSFHVHTCLWKVRGAVGDSKLNVGRLQEGFCRLGMPRLGCIERVTHALHHGDGNLVWLQNDMDDFCFAMMGDEVDEIRIRETVGVHPNQRTRGSRLHHSSYRSERMILGSIQRLLVLFTRLTEIPSSV